MIGANNKQAFLLKTLVTLDIDGDAFSAGATITFPKAFKNIPAACVIPPLGTVDLTTTQTAAVWTATCTTTECVITLISAIPSEYFLATIEVAVFVHEQL